MANIILSEEEHNELKKSRDSWRECYYDLRYALRKDEQLDESISCVRDIPSDVEMIEDLKKRAADSDYYKELSELLKERNNELKEKLKKANELIQTISDQEVTIKALLITIKEMCKEENENA